jgi:drug/metabolite transporter (DMT)-like permease
MEVTQSKAGMTKVVVSPMKAGSAAKARPPGATVQGFGLLLFTAISWGLNWPLVKFLLTQMPPFTMRAIAGALGASATFAVAAWLGERLLPRADQWRPLLLSSLLNFTSFMAASTLGMVWLSASEAVIIAYTMPFWAVLMAWPVLGERPTATRLAALVLGLSGVGVLMGTQPIQASWAKLPGVAIALAGAVMFALGTVLSKRRPLALPPVVSVAWQVGIGSIPLALPALFEHPHWNAISLPAILSVVYLGLVPLSLAYLTWFRALRVLPASTAATAILMVPVIGVFGSATLIGEPLGARQLAALAFTLAGVGLAART